MLLLLSYLTLIFNHLKFVLLQRPKSQVGENYSHLFSLRPKNLQIFMSKHTFRSQ